MVAAIAVPIALQNLLSTTGSMVDTIMLARLGEKTVGAVGLCAQFSSLMFSGYWGFLGGGMLFFSQFWGAGDEDGIRHSYGITFTFIISVGLLFGILALTRPSFVMHIYTDSEEICAIGEQYLGVVGFAYPLMTLSMTISALLRCIERVRIPLYASIASVFANCLFNYLLIFGHLGFPRLGVVGAAWGTVIGSAVNVIVLYIFILINRVPYITEVREHFRLDLPLLKEYLVKRFPILANERLIGVGNMLINIVLGHQADEAIAAVAVFRTLEGLIIGFFAGFSNAASVLVGKEVGAGNHEDAFERAWRIVYFSSTVVVTVCLVLVAVHTPLFTLMGLSGRSLSIATGMIAIFTVVSWFRLGNWTMNDTYRSAGDSAFGSIMEITFMFLMVQPVIHLANGFLHWPFLVVFALVYCDEPVRYVIMQIHMYSRKWIKPVSDEGRATIDEFRKKYGIRVRQREKG